MDAGVGWLKSIPRGWGLVPLGYIARFVGGATPSKDDVDLWSGDIPWVSPKDMKHEVISGSEDHVAEDALRVSAIKVIPPPAVLIVVRGMILLHSVPIGLTSVPVTVNQDMKALLPRKDCNPEFLQRVLQALERALLIDVEESGHGTRCLRGDRLRKILIPLPSLREQQRVLDFIKEQTTAIDAFAERVRLAIDRLREYRTALISAAVTGKIDVRNYQTTPCQ